MLILIRLKKRQPELAFSKDVEKKKVKISVVSKFNTQGFLNPSVQHLRKKSSL